MRVLVQYERDAENDYFNFDGKTLKRQHKQNKGKYSKDGHMERQKWFIHSQILDIRERQVLLCVDSEFDLLIFDIEAMVASREDLGLLYDLNLFDNAHLFDLVSKHVDDSTGLTLLESQQDLMEQKLGQLKERLSK